MKFDHMVKYNGVYYQTGENVPADEKPKGTKEQLPPLPFTEDDQDTFETVSEKKYTKSEISLMNKADLQSLAAEKGVENAYNMTGTELKALLTDMLVD